MWLLRVASLLIAGAAVAVAAVALSTRGGLSYINLDSALQDSRVFYAFVMGPAVIAACILAALMLPRLLTINITVAVGLLIGLEVGARLLMATPPAAHGEPQAEGTSFYVRDAALGHALSRTATARHRRIVGERQIYDVTYRIDARGRRETPESVAGERRSFLLFFGDSNVFGEGLSQLETLPYFAAEAAPSFRVYNYGVPGYGPAQILTLARRGGIRAEVEGWDGYAVLVVIPAHVGRVVGSSRVSSSWGRHFPHYVEDRDGALVRVGDFTHGRPLTTLGYFWWTKSVLADRLGIELPLWYTERHYRLTARMLHESARLLTEQLNLRGCVVVLVQVYDEAQRRIMNLLRDALTREGVMYLDYTRLIDADDPQYRLAVRDYHSSAKANRIVARQLVADLVGAAPREKSHAAQRQR